MTTASARVLPSRVPLSHELILAGIIVVLAAVFAVTGSNFATAGNLADMVRLAGEVGLLAIALTPIIVTGGIDLSVGSLMGLVAVAVGLLWRDGGLSIWTASVPISSCSTGIFLTHRPMSELPPCVVYAVVV